MSINFLKPLFLLLLIPIIPIFWFMVKKSKYQRLRVLILILRALLVLFLIFALAGPQVVRRFQGQSIVFLADRSKSMDYSEDFTQWILDSLGYQGKKDQSAVIAFAQDTQLLKGFSTTGNFNIGIDLMRDYSNLEGAIKVAQGLLPKDTNNRIVILSDGFENIGDSLAYSRVLKANGIPIDVYPLALTMGSEVAINRINIPSTSYLGQRISVEVEIESTVNTKAVLSILSNEKLLHNGEINVQKGLQKIVFPVDITGTGFQRIKASIEPQDDTILNNNLSQGLTYVESAPKVLLVEGIRGVGVPLNDVFTANNIDVDYITVNQFPKNLESLMEYKSIFFVDVPAYHLHESQLINIKTFVDVLGGGFVSVGGRNSFGVGFYQDTPLEEILPVNMEVENKEELPGMDMILIIDRSGSMSGEKFNMAKNAAISALDILNERDRLALITFDDLTYVNFGLSSLTDKQKLRNIIENLTIGGGTSIYPALRKAYGLFEENNKSKHIILLSDGVEGEQDYEELLKNMRDSSITLSTIALGEDADIKLMEYLAVNGGGRFYDVRNSEDLPGVFTKETLLAGGNYIIEEDFTPQVVRSSFIPFTQGSPLFNGYIGSTLKPTAEGIIFTHKDHPLYSRMQYGLGRTVAFTTDTYGMWSRNFLMSSDFPAFWMNTLNWVSGRGNYGDIALDIVLKDAGAEVFIKVGNPLDENERIEVVLVDEKGNKQIIRTNAISATDFKGKTNELHQGIYMINATRYRDNQVTALNVNGLSVPYSEEFAIANLTSNSKLLEELAMATGGRVLRRPYEVFNAQYDPVKRSIDLSWLFLLFALVIWPLDIAVRRFMPSIKLPKRKKKEKVVRQDVEINTISQLLKAKDKKN